MDVAMGNRPEPRAAFVPSRPSAPDAFLAGLQAGMLGILWMLAWLGVSATWQRRSFWTAENLMASAFHPASGVSDGLTWETFSGLAVYLLLYSLLGGLFAMAISRETMRPVRTTLLALAFGLTWYYTSFEFLWKTLAPALAYLHPERSTILGHAIYGLLVGRFYLHFPSERKPFADPAAAPESSSEPVTPNA